MLATMRRRARRARTSRPGSPRARRRGRARRRREDAVGRAAGQARPGRPTSPPEELDAHRGRHDRHRRPGPDVPQGDRQGAAPQRRGRGRPGQGDRARRADHRRAAEGHPVAVGVDQERDRVRSRARSTRSTACRTRTRRIASCAARSRPPRRTACSRPRSFQVRKAQRSTAPGQGAPQGGQGHAAKAEAPTRTTSRRLVDFSFTPSTAATRSRTTTRPCRPVRVDPRPPRGAAALDLRRPRLEASGRDGLDPRAGRRLKPRDRRGVLVRIGGGGAGAADVGQPRLVVSIAKKYIGRGMSSWTSSRKATSASSAQSRSSTTRRASSSRPTPRGGSGRPSPARSPTRRGRSASRSTWSRRSTASIRVSRGLLQELGREPTVEEIAEAMSRGQEVVVTPDKVREIIKVSQEPVSLETPIGEEEDSHLGDFIEDRRGPGPGRGCLAPAAQGAGRGRARLAVRPRATRARSSASGWRTAVPAPSRKWARSSTSPASASARSRRRRCASCATRPAAASSRTTWSSATRVVCGRSRPKGRLLRFGGLRAPWPASRSISLGCSVRMAAVSGIRLDHGHDGLHDRALVRPRCDGQGAAQSFGTGAHPGHDPGVTSVNRSAAKPRPSSRMDIRRKPSGSPIRTFTWSAAACLTTLCSASWRCRYRFSSISRGSRSGRSVSTRIDNPTRLSNAPAWVRNACASPSRSRLPWSQLEDERAHLGERLALELRAAPRTSPVLPLVARQQHLDAAGRE